MILSSGSWQIPTFIAPIIFEILDIPDIPIGVEAH
jgi:hypothetical protein